MRNDDTSLPRGAVIPPASERDFEASRRSEDLDTMLLNMMTGTGGFCICMGLSLLCALTEQTIGYLFSVGFTIAALWCSIMAFHAKEKVLTEFSPSERGRRGTESGAHYASVPLILPGNEVKLYMDNGDEAKIVSLREFKR